MPQGVRMSPDVVQSVWTAKAQGQSTRQIASLLGIARGSVFRALKQRNQSVAEAPSAVHAVQTKNDHPPVDIPALRHTMTEKWKQKAAVLVDALTTDKIEKMGGRDLAVAAGIASDKVRQWAGLDRLEVAQVNNLVIQLFGASPKESFTKSLVGEAVLDLEPSVAPESSQPATSAQ
jgi:hypothetical protein